MQVRRISRDGHDRRSSRCATHFHWAGEPSAESVGVAQGVIAGANSPRTPNSARRFVSYRRLSPVFTFAAAPEEDRPGCRRPPRPAADMSCCWSGLAGVRVSAAVIASWKGRVCPPPARAVRPVRPLSSSLSVLLLTCRPFRGLAGACASRFERSGELRLADFEQSPYVFPVFLRRGCGGLPGQGGGVAGHLRLLPDPGPEPSGGRGEHVSGGGRTARPSGSNTPPSSKATTPLHSRLHPCSGWLATVCAPLRSWARALGHRGRCGHCRSAGRRAALRDWMVVMSCLPG